MAPLSSFIIYGLPRARTAWLAALLTYGAWRCTHEVAITLRSIEDVRELLTRPLSGTVETGVSPARPLIRHLAPAIREVVLFRPVEEVIASVRAIDVSRVAVYDFDLLRRNLVYLDRTMRAIARQPGVLSVDHADLANENGCRRVFEFCLPYRFDVDWWSAMKDRNIQVDVVEHLRYYLENRAAIDELKRVCKTEMRRLARARAIRKAAA